MKPESTDAKRKSCHICGGLLDRDGNCPTAKIYGFEDDNDPELQARVSKHANWKLKGITG